MEIDRTAPATAEQELQIDADPSTVFNVLATLDEWPSWNPGVRSVHLDGPVEPGTEFRWRAGPSTIMSKLEVVDPPHEITWTGRTMGIRAVHTFGFDRRDGGTLARSRGVMGWAAPAPPQELQPTDAGDGDREGARCAEDRG